MTVPKPQSFSIQSTPCRVSSLRNVTSCLVEQGPCHIKVGIVVLLLTASLGPVLFSVVLFLSDIALASVCDKYVFEIGLGFCACALVVLLRRKLLCSHIRLHCFSDIDILEVLLGVCTSCLFVLSAMVEEEK